MTALYIIEHLTTLYENVLIMAILLEGFIVLQYGRIFASKVGQDTWKNGYLEPIWIIL